MATTYAERTAQALSIQELVSAIAAIQALIQADDGYSPITTAHLRTAYRRLADALAKRSLDEAPWH